MDMGLAGRTVAIRGGGDLASRVAALVRAEQAGLIDDDAGLGVCDALVVIAPDPGKTPLAGLSDAEAFDSWSHVTDLARTCREAAKGMSSRGYGRIVWVGPLDAKLTRDDPGSDLGALVGLGALGLMKAMSGELGPDGITCSSVLWDGDDSQAAAAATLFFASSASAYVTGTVLSVDSGKSRSLF